MSRTLKRAGLGAAVAVALVLAGAPAAHALPGDVPANRPPDAKPTTATAVENTPTSFTLQATDPDGDPLAYAVTKPANGTATVNTSTGLVAYTPGRNFVGTDTFAFTVVDPHGAKDTATVTVAVADGRSFPNADDGSVATPQDNPTAVRPSASDPDPKDSLTYRVVSGPSHGFLDAATASTRNYTPKPGFVGVDTLTFVATDQTGLVSNVATFTITVLAAVQADRPPVADNESVETTKDVPVAVTLSGSDPDDDFLAFRVLISPAHGSLSGEAPHLTYTPTAGYTGPDSFRYASEAQGVQSPPATVSITVKAPAAPPVNLPPTAKNLTRTTIVNRKVAVTLSGHDPEGGPLTYTVGTPKHGRLLGNAPALTYQPDRWFSGVDTFTYTVSDGVNTSAPATVKIVVRGVKSRPIAYDQSVTTGKHHPVKIVLNGFSRTHGHLTYRIVDGPDHGTVYRTGSHVLYVADRHFKGVDRLRFVVRDSHGRTSKPATVRITVKGWYSYSHR